MSSLVSVIIPSYNGDRFIAEAVDSILRQTYPNIELIVVDDESSDRTFQILQTYGDRIMLIRQVNQGVAAARNRGLQEAKGSYIAFLDQDDTYQADKIKHQIACFEDNSDLGCVNSGWNIVEENGHILSSVKPWHGIPDLDLAAWIIWKPVFLGAMLFHRGWLEKIGGFDVTLQQTSDVDLALRLAIATCPSTWLKQVTVNYRQHSHNASHNVHQQAHELETVLSKIFSCPDLPQHIRILEHPSRYQTLVWCAWRFYHYGFFQEMADYLGRSLHSKAQQKTLALLDWIECFQRYEAEYGQELNCYELSQTPQWRQLVKEIVM